MKKLLLACSLFAITATSAFAGNDKNISALTPEQRVDYSIQNQLVMPSFLTEVPGTYTAELHFHITQQGGVVVSEILTDNADLKHSLMYQSKSISVNTEGLDTDSMYKMTVQFRVIQQD